MPVLPFEVYLWLAAAGVGGWRLWTSQDLSRTHRIDLLVLTALQVVLAWNAWLQYQASEYLRLCSEFMDKMLS